MTEDPLSSQNVLSVLTQHLEKPEDLGPGSLAIRDAAIRATKSVFDASLNAEPSSIKYVNDLLSSLSPFNAPQTRSMSLAKSSNQPPVPSITFNPTPLASLFVDDLEEEQIWAQLDLRTKHICELVDALLEGELSDPVIRNSDDEEMLKAFSSDGMLFGPEDDKDEGEDHDESMSEGELFGDGDALDGEHSEEDDSVDEEDNAEQSLESDESDEVHVPLRSSSQPSKHRGSEVDDGFFSLSSFKAEVERAEAKSSSRGNLAVEEDSDDDSDLRSVDLFAAVEEEDTEASDNAKELFYGDFFEPPRSIAPQKMRPSAVRFNDEVRVKKIKTSPKEQLAHPKHAADDEDSSDVDSDFDGEDVDMDASSDAGSEGFSESEQEIAMSAIERLKDDLFADDGDDDAQKDLSTHEKRMSALRAQISELEAQNVGPKDWTLMGEASSKARPQNSLLEEDLEFERVMKPVPVITEEKVQTLEELIKARILENRFDDVVRIRPMDDKAFLPSRILELQDTKSTQSLSQIYENEYLAAQGQITKVDDRDGKLKKEHDEIELLWDKLCEKLDALSNTHFVPKQPKSLISTVSDVSTATLESALPTTKSATSMLAPEEVFSTIPSQLRDRSELTPVEKRAVRTKERKLRKKQRDLLDKTVAKTAQARGIGSVKKQKQDALASIVKHGKGVTVVGKSAKDFKSTNKRHKKSARPLQ